MKPFLPLLLFFLVPSLLSGAGVLRIGTWNLRNYLLQNRWEDGQFRFEYPKPETEKAALRRLILRARPDVLLLQEIGSDQLLAELQEDLSVSGLRYTFRHLSILDGSRSGLSILSVLEPEEILFHDPRDGETGQSVTRRGIQELLFRLEGASLRIFHVHLKSRYTSDDADPDSLGFRTVELAAFGDLIDRRRDASGGEETLLLAGDFNAPFDSPILEELRQKGEFLEVEDAEGGNWTYHHFRTGRHERIDGFWALRTPAMDMAPVAVFPLGAGRLNGSDHRMVVVDWTRGSFRDVQSLPPRSR